MKTSTLLITSLLLAVQPCIGLAATKRLQPQPQFSAREHQHETKQLARRKSNPAVDVNNVSKKVPKLSLSSKATQFCPDAYYYFEYHVRHLCIQQQSDRNWPKELHQCLNYYCEIIINHCREMLSTYVKDKFKKTLWKEPPRARFEPSFFVASYSYKTNTIIFNTRKESLFDQLLKASTREQRSRAHMLMCLTIAHEMGHYLQDILNILDKNNTVPILLSAWTTQEHADALLNQYARQIAYSQKLEYQADEAVLLCYPDVTRTDLLKMFDFIRLSSTSEQATHPYDTTRVDTNDLLDFIESAHPSAEERSEKLCLLLEDKVSLSNFSLGLKPMVREANAKKIPPTLEKRARKPKRFFCL